MGIERGIRMEVLNSAIGFYFGCISLGCRWDKIDILVINDTDVEYKKVIFGNTRVEANYKDREFYFEGYEFSIKDRWFYFKDEKRIRIPEDGMFLLKLDDGRGVFRVDCYDNSKNTISKIEFLVSGELISDHVTQKSK